MAVDRTGPGSTIGGRIAQARFALAAQQGKNVTQTWLAQQVGVSGPTVSQWEAGITEPTLASVAKIAAALGVSAGWLAFGEASVPVAADTGQKQGTRLDDEVVSAAVEAVAARKRPAQKKAGNGHPKRH